MTAELRAEKLTRTFAAAGGDVHACADIDLDLHPGELVVVRGPSGAGKTTLLNLLGTLDRPTSGRLLLDGTDVTGLGDEALAALRRERFGFVFQAFGLIPVLTASENVEVPLRIAGVGPAEALRLVGLTAQAPQRPGELSGGQQQRVGIARAIVSRPRILVADEPTGQLDSRTAATIMDLLVELAHSQGLAAIVATHDPLLVARADRVVELHDGRLTAGSRPAPGDAADAAPFAPGSALGGDADAVPHTRAEARAQRHGSGR